MNRKRYRQRDVGGFTLAELMVVLGIIILLIAILVPTVSRVRRAGHVASVQNQLNGIAAAIERYRHDFNACPGPLPNAWIYTNTPIANFSGPGLDTRKITAAENLVLGLLGGLRLGASPGTFVYDPSQVGMGPMNLNLDNPKRYSPYMESMDLSAGKYEDGAGAADDSVIPEFVDRFPSSMPILYLRARVGADGVISTAGPTQYQLRDIAAYTIGAAGSIGEGKRIRQQDYVNFAPVPTVDILPHGLQSVNPNRSLIKGQPGYQYPYDAHPYFSNPNVPNTPRSKDGFILISAGPDRVYGTEDDITSFGSVLP